MKLNPNCLLSEEQIKRYDSFIEQIKNPINCSKLSDLYCVLLQTSFGLEENKNSFSINNVEKFSGEILSKLLNEGWAIIGCFEKAAFLSSFHHTRAALELIACYYWTTYKESKIQKRIEKYFEFKNLYLYQLFVKYGNSPDKDSILPLFNFTDEQILCWKSRELEWKNLFKPVDDNLLKVKNWYYNTLIDHMLEEFPNKKLKLFYEEFSHATHFSPFSRFLGTSDTIIGLPINIEGDLSEINRPLTIYLDSLEFLLSWIEKSTRINIKVKFP